MDLDYIAGEFRFSRLVTYLMGNPEANIEDESVFGRMLDELFPKIDVFTKQDVAKVFGIDKEDLDDLDLESIDGASGEDIGVLYSRENVLERYSAVTEEVWKSIQAKGLDDVRANVEDSLDKLVFYFAKNSLIPFARDTRDTKLNLSQNYIPGSSYVNKYITTGDLRQAISSGGLKYVKYEVSSGGQTSKVDRINGYSLAIFILSKALESPSEESVAELFGVSKLKRPTVERYGLGPGVRGSYSHINSIYETVAERAKKFVLNGPWNKDLCHPVEIKGTREDNGKPINAGTFYFTMEAIKSYCKCDDGEDISEREFYEDRLPNLIRNAESVDRVAPVSHKEDRTAYSSFNYKFVTEGNAIVAINPTFRGDGARRGSDGMSGRGHGMIGM